MIADKFFEATKEATRFCGKLHKCGKMRISDCVGCPNNKPIQKLETMYKHFRGLELEELLLWEEQDKYEN